MSKKSENRTWFLKGMKDGVPIAMGYFAVAFALGIAAKRAGMSAVQAHRELLYQIQTPISKFMYDITRVYSDIHWSWERRMGCELCDALIPAYLLEPSVITAVDAFVDIETQGICAGTSVVYRTERYPEKKPNCRVAVSADGKLFFALLFRYLFPEYEEALKHI